MKNNNLYANTSYSGELGDHWLIRTGISFGLDREDLLYIDQPVLTGNMSVAARLAFTHLTSKRLKIRMGGEFTSERYRQEIPMEVTYTLGMNDLEPALFLEPELKISERIAVRMGVRGEYSTLLQELNLHPRLSAAIKTGKYSQVSMAWGRYSQKPGNDYLKFAPGLDAELSDHYILNFQYRTQTRTFRAEAYDKQYDHLVKYLEPNNPDPSQYNNGGKGYARGIDLFWRDKETLKGVDYWISYSFLDTRRDYRDYPSSVMPQYASRHNLSVVYKQFLTPIHTYVGATYSFASGRPYDDKNADAFMSGLTRSYNDLSLNLTYLTRIFGKESVIHMNITNLLGFKNVFGYLYSETPGEDGQYASRAVVPTYGRQAILVLLIMLN
jgi:outer membrane receptor for ferrienterochelin and colicin